MYEMLFHGKMLDTGEWVEGFYHYRDYVFNGETVRKHYILPINAQDAVEVNPNTVGRSTGLSDKNGKKIFEGDILQDEGIMGGVSRCVIEFGLFNVYGTDRVSEVGFFLYWESDKRKYHKYGNLVYWIQEREAVCVGNIHDNPELLEGGVSDGV